MEKYIKLDVLGNGSNGSVSLVKNLEYNTLFAMKKLFIDLKNEKEKKSMINEVKILSELHHPNIISYYESFNYKNSICIIMEYADKGDLQAVIKKHIQDNTLIEETLIWNWFLQTCHAVGYIHERNILHRDIKSQNIFINKEGDFGISKSLKNEIDFASTTVGTPYFLSPEICLGEKYNLKSDIWMLGCFLYELCTLRKPFSEYKPIPDQYSEDIKLVLNLLLAKEPNFRPTIKDLLNFDFVKKHDDELNKKENKQDKKVNKLQISTNYEDELDETPDEIIENCRKDRDIYKKNAYNVKSVHHKPTQSHNFNLNSFNRNFHSPVQKVLSNFQISPMEIRKSQFNQNQNQNHQSHTGVTCHNNTSIHNPNVNDCKKMPINLIKCEDMDKLLKQNLMINSNINSHNNGNESKRFYDYNAACSLTNEEKVFILKQREKSSNCERNKINKIKDNTSPSNNVSFCQNIISQCQLKENNTNESSSGKKLINNIPKSNSKTHIRKANNTSKHASKNRIKMDFSIEQTSEDGTTIKLENYEEFQNNQNQNNIKQNKSNSNISYSKDINKEKATSPSLRRYSQGSSSNSKNKDILQSIQKFSVLKYGEDKTNKLLLLINQLGNPKEVLSKVYLLKEIFNNDYLEAKEYFSPLFS